jgi:hypothetical protein
MRRPSRLPLALAAALLACALAAGSAGAAEPPAPSRLTALKLSGVADRAPKLSFALAARPGAELTTVTVTTPPGLVAASSPRALAKGVLARAAGGAKLAARVSVTAQTIRIALAEPQASARFKLSRPALSVTPKLLEHVKSGVTRKLGLIVTARETGGLGSRFPVVVTLQP